MSTINGKYFRFEEVVVHFTVDVVAHFTVQQKQMWWLIVNGVDFWMGGPWLEKGISLNDPGVLQEHCVIL